MIIEYGFVCQTNYFRRMQDEFRENRFHFYKFFITILIPQFAQKENENTLSGGKNAALKTESILFCFCKLNTGKVAWWNVHEQLLVKSWNLNCSSDLSPNEVSVYNLQLKQWQIEDFNGTIIPPWCYWNCSSYRKLINNIPITVKICVKSITKCGDLTKISNKGGGRTLDRKTRKFLNLTRKISFEWEEFSIKLVIFIPATKKNIHKIDGTVHYWE